MNLSHHFLLSMPSLANSWFENTITYVFEHNDNGALGFVINRPAPISVAEVYRQLDIDVIDSVRTDAVVFEGGPIDTQRGFILFDAASEVVTESADLESHIESGDHGVNLCGSTDLLDNIGAGNGPQDYLLLLGYAGWGAGQLESEMSENSWLTCAASTDILFNDDYQHRFQLAADSLGVDFSRLSNDTGHA